MHTYPIEHRLARPRVAQMVLRGRFRIRGVCHLPIDAAVGMRDAMDGYALVCVGLDWAVSSSVRLDSLWSLDVFG